MPFPQRLLNDDEEIVLDLRPHWWFVSGPASALAASLALALYVATLTSAGWIRIPFLVVVLVALAWFLGRMARRATSELVLTSHRLIVRSGILVKRGREIPLERINDLTSVQPLFKRLLGVGDLMVESGGEQGQQRIPCCSHPRRVQNEIHNQIDAARDRDAERRSGRRELSPLEYLEKLHELRQRGVISQAEFDAKKSQLLGRL